MCLHFVPVNALTPLFALFGFVLFVVYLSRMRFDGPLPWIVSVFGILVAAKSIAGAVGLANRMANSKDSDKD